MPIVQYSACQKRVEEEDVAFVQERQTPSPGGPLWSLYCICDGHAGGAAANYVRRHLWKVLGPLLPTGHLPESPQDFEQFALAVRVAVIKAHVRIGYKFKLEYPLDTSGTTVTMALLCGRLLTLANLGDSSAVVFTGSAAFLATVSHSLQTNMSECKRLSDAGLVLAHEEVPCGWGPKRMGPLRCWPGGLLVSRSVGDIQSGERILSWPHVSQVILPRSGSRLLMGTGGLWDAVDWQAAAYGIRGMPVADAAASAVRLAVGPGSRPAKDVSAVVIDVMPPNGRTFPELVFAPRSKERPKKSHLAARLMKMLHCASCRPRRAEEASPSRRGDDLRVLANIDGWVLLKMAVKTALLGSYSILSELTSGLLPEAETARMKQSIECARPHLRRNSAGGARSEGEASDAATALATEITEDCASFLTPLSSRRDSSLNSVDFREFSSAPAAWRAVASPRTARTDGTASTVSTGSVGHAHRRSRGQWSSGDGLTAREGLAMRIDAAHGARHGSGGLRDDPPARVRQSRAEPGRQPAPRPIKTGGSRARRDLLPQPTRENSTRVWMDRPASAQGHGYGSWGTAGKRSAPVRPDGSRRPMPSSGSTPSRGRDAHLRIPSPIPSLSSEGAGHVVSYTMSPAQDSAGDWSLSGVTASEMSERRAMHCSSRSIYGYMSHRKASDKGACAGSSDACAGPQQQFRAQEMGFVRGGSDQWCTAHPGVDPYAREGANQASLRDPNPSMFGTGPFEPFQGHHMHCARGSYNQDALLGHGWSSYITGVSEGELPKSQAALHRGRRVPSRDAVLDNGLAIPAMGQSEQEPLLENGISVYVAEEAVLDGCCMEDNERGLSRAGGQLVPDISSVVMDSITKVNAWEADCKGDMWGALPTVPWASASNPLYKH